MHVDGTVNKRDGTDRGWTAEIAIPWKGLQLLADGRSLPPKDGDVWRIDCSRFQKIGRNGEVLDPCAGWTWNRHGHYDSHIPEVFPEITFSTAQIPQSATGPKIFQGPMWVANLRPIVNRPSPAVLWSEDYDERIGFVWLRLCCRGGRPGGRPRPRAPLVALWRSLSTLMADRTLD